MARQTSTMQSTRLDDPCSSLFDLKTPTHFGHNNRRSSLLSKIGLATLPTLFVGALNAGCATPIDLAGAILPPTPSTEIRQGEGTAFFAIGGFSQKLHEDRWQALMDTMASDLGAYYHYAVAPIEATLILDDIEKASNAGNKIVLLLYSLGGYAGAMDIFPVLAAKGIKVDVLTLVDTGSFNGTVPDCWTLKDFVFPDIAKSILTEHSSLGPFQGAAITPDRLANQNILLTNCEVQGTHGSFWFDAQMREMADVINNILLQISSSAIIAEQIWK